MSGPPFDLVKGIVLGAISFLTVAAIYLIIREHIRDNRPTPRRKATVHNLDEHRKRKAS